VSRFVLKRLEVIFYNSLTNAIIPAHLNILTSAEQIVAYMILSKLGVKIATISIILLFL